jgi:hypothetical protein
MQLFVVYCHIKALMVVYGVLRHFQQYFSFIVAINFIGGENRSKQRKPLTYIASHRQALSYYVVSSTPRHELKTLTVLLVEEKGVPRKIH